MLQTKERATIGEKTCNVKGPNKQMSVSPLSCTSRCALCRERRVLCDSHIIPEFLYEPLYDSKHRVFRLSTAGKPKRSFEQKGVREYLLCRDCECQLSRYEGYARDVLYEASDVVSGTPQGFEFLVDYRQFKLFELSILWRVGVSRLPEFKDVNLGSHERRLRNMLRQESPGATEEYGCIKIWPLSYRNIMDQLIMSMGMGKIERVQCCRLVIGGMCWFFFLSRNAIDARQEGLFLQDTGALRIMLGDFGIPGYMQKLAKDLYVNNPHVFPLKH